MNEQVEHPYGTVKYNVWMPAYSHRFDTDKKEHDIQKAKGYEIRFLNNPDGYEIRSLYRNGRILKHTSYKDGDNSVLFRIDGVSVHSLVSHVMLMSAFPDIQPERTVDHIDNNHQNMNIMNLQWLDMSANSAKRAQFKEKADAFTIQIPNDEIWVDYKLGKTTFKISNYARVEKPSGVITIGTKNRSKKYRAVALNYKDNEEASQCKRFYVHRLIWEAFNGAIPDDKEVLHNDAAPVHPDGSYRNWLQDLSIGTRKENMVQFHSHRAGSSSNAISTHIAPDEGYTTVTVQKRPRYAENTNAMPTGFWLQKASGNKGCVVVVQIKRASKNGKVLYWKSPSSPKYPTPLKIEVAKKFVRWVLLKHPDMAIYCDSTGYNENQDVLSSLSESDYTFYKQFEFREQDDPYNELKASQMRKRVVSHLPPDCGVTEDMLPRYCTYRPATDKRGDKFSLEGHPKLLERLGLKRYGTSETRSMSTLAKYNQLMEFMQTLEDKVDVQA